MTDDAAYQQGERVKAELFALVDKAQARRVESGEISMEEAWRQQDQLRRRRRRRRTRAAWIQHHAALSAAFRAAALAEEAKAADLVAEHEQESF